LKTVPLQQTAITLATLRTTADGDTVLTHNHPNFT